MRPLCPPQPRFQRRCTRGSPGDPAPSQTLVKKEAREKGRLSSPCRPAQQAWARSQQLGNRSRKGTSFLSRAGSLGQKWKGEQRRGLCAEAARNAQVHGQARPLGPKWVFHIQRGQASELGGSRNLGVGVAGRGVGLGVGLTGRKEEVVEVGEVAGNQGLPWDGLKVLIRAACILDCHSPSASAPLLGQGRKPKASWEPAAFWKPRRGLSTSTQGTYLYSGVWAALLHEREETSPGGGGGSWTRSDGHRPWVARLTFSVEGLPLRAFKVEGDRLDPRTNHPAPPHLRHSPCVLARRQNLSTYPPPLDSAAEGLGAVKEVTVSS